VQQDDEAEQSEHYGQVSLVKRPEDLAGRWG